MTSSEHKKSFLNELWDRRFFQFFATYVGVSWGLIQFMEWIVRRYDVPSAWVDKLVIFLLLLLPMMISFIYLHGRSGADRWWRFEKIFYPINVVFALVTSLFLIGGVAQETTSSVEITNEAGVTIMREVPKMEFSKRVVIFPFENDNEKDPSWRGIGSAILLSKELEQDMRISCVSPLKFNESYTSYNYEVYQQIPFSTKRNISENHYSDFFVCGKYLNDDESKMEVLVYDTESGAEIGSVILDSKNPISLTEKISEFVSKKIKLAPVEGQNILIDLPASNLITADTAAFRQYVLGSIIPEKDLTKVADAIPYLEKSIAIDPTCAECHATLANLLMVTGQDIGPHFKEAMKYIHNISERQQLNLKYLNYMITSQKEKAVKLLQNWRKLYPQDVKPVEVLVEFYTRTFQNAEAKKELESAFEDGHKGKLYLTYANLMITSKNWDQAEAYLIKYKEAYPKQAESATLLADTFEAQGKFKKAIEVLDELSIMQPNDISYEMKKAKIFNKDNQFDKADSLVNRLLENATKVSDSISIYSTEMEMLARRGLVKQYYDTKRKLKKSFLKVYPPIAFLQTEYATSSFYSLIGSPDSISYYLDLMVDLLPPSQKELVGNLNSFIIDLFSENVDGLDESYPKVKNYLQTAAGENIINIYDSEIAYLKGDYDHAIDIWHTFMENVDAKEMVSQNYYEAFIKVGKYEEGLEKINLQLQTDPKNSFHLLVKAKLLAKLKKYDDAKEILGQALFVLKDADENHKYRIQAYELKAELDAVN